MRYKNDLDEPLVSLPGGKSDSLNYNVGAKAELKVSRVTFNYRNPDYVGTALTLYNSGCTPIPLRPRSDKPAVGWERWTTRLSAQSIRQYWHEYPKHELGIMKEESE
jgi:hypothetical protein